MAQTTKRIPRSPKQATRRRAAVDRTLDADLFKALSDPTRIRLLACVMKCCRPCSVSEVAECCEVDFSVVSRHLAHLGRAGLLHVQKEGRAVRYQARADELCRRFRDIADAIDEWRPARTGRACAAGDCCDGA